MATTRFTVKCVAGQADVVYYGYNCPREGEYIALNGLKHQVISVIHYPRIPYHDGWEEVVIKVDVGREIK